MLPGKGSCVETCDYTKVYDGASWEVAETTLACGYHLIVITSLTHCNRADRVLAKYVIGILHFQRCLNLVQERNVTAGENAAIKYLRQVRNDLPLV